MNLKSFSPDKIAISGCVLGLISLFPGWFILKPHRLSAGMSVNLPDSAGLALTILVGFLWMSCFVLSFAGKNDLQHAILGITADVILIFVFIFLSMASNNLDVKTHVSARVSPGAGFWLTMLSAYIVIFAAEKKLEDRLIIKNIITWTAPAVFLFFLFTRNLRNFSVVVEFAVQRQRFIQEFLHHIILVAVSVFFGSIIGILLGILAKRSKKARNPVFFITDISQTIPSLALFGLLIAPLSVISFKYPFLREIGIRGIGNAPALIALIIYCLLPVVRNTYSGLAHIDKSVIDAGKGMGMSKMQVFLKIEVPLSAPLVLEGIRISSVQGVGLTAVAALIGAGGLGWFIFQGLGQAAPDMILLGTIPIIILALFTDGVMRMIIKFTANKVKKQKDHNRL
ncbi:ABC transporter permease [bacterium]|nr:ABC transporter permease [bacterium]